MVKSCVRGLPLRKNVWGIAYRKCRIISFCLHASLLNDAPTLWVFDLLPTHLDRDSLNFIRQCRVPYRDSLWEKIRYCELSDTPVSAGGIIGGGNDIF